MEKEIEKEYTREEELRDFKKAQSLMEKHCSSYILITQSEYGVWHSIKIDESKNKTSEKMIENVEELIFGVLIHLINNKKVKDSVTKGQVNLAYSMLLDMIQNVILLGAYDEAGIIGDVFDKAIWATKEKILDALNDDEIVDFEESLKKTYKKIRKMKGLSTAIEDEDEARDEDEDEGEDEDENEDEDEDDVITCSPKDALKLVRAVSYATGIPEDTVMEAFLHSIVGTEKE